MLRASIEGKLQELMECKVINGTRKYLTIHKGSFLQVSFVRKKKEISALLGKNLYIPVVV